MQEFSISENFNGGCITVDKIENDHVYLKINNRDGAPWFYWAFCVKNANGKKLTFHFEEQVLGYYGPAVSHDLSSWAWLYPQSPVMDKNMLNEFSYEFKKDETCVYFAHNYLYGVEKFAFDGVEVKELCEDIDGSSCPYITIGTGEKTILFTARHHACEGAASYMLHGVISEMLSDMLSGYKIICVPFVDVRGVIAGDQGKGRLPHDHNRDYTDSPIYPTVRAIKGLILQNHVRYAVDFHDPMGAGDDRMRLVNHGIWLEEEERLSLLYSSLCLDGAFKHERGAITKLGFTDGMFSTYVANNKNVRYATTIEAPYFGKPENMMTEQSFLATGVAFAKAFKQLITELDKEQD